MVKYVSLPETLQDETPGEELDLLPRGSGDTVEAKEEIDLEDFANNEMFKRNEEAIKKYIANQMQEDKLYEQLSMKEYIDPFTGEPVQKSK